MLNRAIQNVTLLLGGGALALLLLGVDLFSTIPYREVERTRLELVEGRVEYVADFRKNGDCTFGSLAVLKNSVSGWVATSWEDLETPRGDRLEGRQTLSISFEYDDSVDAFEIRTRHFCGDNDTKVDKVFDVIYQGEL